ncbi:MAG: hypothetical protein ACR9NN_01315 [Nostochopsis sp.]
MVLRWRQSLSEGIPSRRLGTRDLQKCVGEARRRHRFCVGSVIAFFMGVRSLFCGEMGYAYAHRRHRFFVGRSAIAFV